ncbi:MAG: phosphatase domain-containing putative toxin [Promethearchaeota archaeon]
MDRPWYWPIGGMPEKANPFDWIVKNKMAASWWPDNMVLKIYERENIKVIINCSEFDNKRNIPSNYSYYHIKIPDYGIPTEEQIKRFLKITDYHGKRKEAIVTHCVAGCGRTGQMIVAWAAKNNYIQKNMDPVKWIQKKRPCSLETREQMESARHIVKKVM